MVAGGGWRGVVRAGSKNVGGMPPVARGVGLSVLVGLPG